MKAWDRLKSALRPRAHVRTIFARRKFEGGQTDRLVASWTTGDGTSINGEIYNSLEAMRSRSRDLQQNNEYGAHFFRTLVNNVAGPSGWDFQAQAMGRDGKLDRRDNDTVETHFARWSKQGSCDTTRGLTRTQMERMFVETLARDGEVLIRKHVGFRNDFRFALEFIDPVLLDIHHNVEPSPGQNRIVMGVELDEFYAPVGYHILTKFPSPWTYAMNAGAEVERYFVPAEEMIHAFVRMRPRQVRGVPWVHAGMRALRDLGGYREAAIIAARVGAAKVGFWRSQDGQGGTYDGKDATGSDFEIAEPGRFQRVPADLTLETWDPSYPHDQFGDFNKAMLRGLAGAFGVSYHTLNNDLESVNLSSARIGQQPERDFYVAVQDLCVGAFQDQYFPDWLTANMAAMGLPMTKFDKFDFPAWIGRRWPSADPLKDAQANATNLGIGVTSPQRVIRSLGLDPDEVVQEIKQWRDRLQAEGIPITHANVVSLEGSADETEEEGEGESEPQDSDRVASIWGGRDRPRGPRRG